MLDVLDIWKREYGPDAMTPVQEEVIRHILRGRDALVVMPAGEDRSLCFQVPVLLMSGWKVVISSRFRERKEGRTLYVRPERVPRALGWLRGRPVSLFVVDDAQRMGTWRKDYRTAYGNLGMLRRWFPGVPIAAFSSDAGDVMRHFLFSQLWLRGWAVFEDASGTGEHYMARQRRLHKNAYAKWSPEDDRTLLMMYRTGSTVQALAAAFARNEGAIRSRLRKLETNNL